MAKICPQTNDVVLYLECLECPDKGKCRTDKKETEKSKKKINSQKVN